MTQVADISTVVGLPEQATTWYDRLLQALWPASQGQLTYSVYARLIERLYQDTNTLILGYFTVSAPTLAIAVSDNNIVLLWEIWFVLLPIAAFRIYSCKKYTAQPALLKYNYARRDEARYFVGTLTVVAAISVILTTINLTSSEQSRFIMAIVCVGYMTGIMARNAMSPRLVFVLSAIISVPTAYGLISLHNSLGYWTAALVIGLPFQMSRIAYAGKHETVTALIQAEAAERLANFDVLTGLPNRHFVTSYLREKVGSLKGDDSLCVLMLDIDRFKQINDSRGHPIGDQLLIEAGARIASAAKSVDPLALTARLGGDEFIVVTGAAGEETAIAINRDMQTPFDLAATRIATSCSIGVKRFVNDEDEVALLKGADLALYAAKHGGRSGWRSYEQGMEEAADRAALFEERFRRALSRNEFYVVYQPIIGLETGRAVCFEALARWDDETLGRVSPVEFIPFAEAAGLIDALTGALLARACTELSAFDPNASLSFNVSVAEFAQPERLIGTIKQALADSSFSPDRLCIEITEGVLIADFEAVLAALRTIKQLGVRIALDDFGSGYSSLSYLAKLSHVIDTIKLDKSIVNDAMNNGVHETIVQMVAKVAQTIGAIVVAEGIEDEYAASQMKRLGASHAQGYYFGRPDSLLAWSKRLLAEATRKKEPPAVRIA